MDFKVGKKILPCLYWIYLLIFWMPFWPLWAWCIRFRRRQFHWRLWLIRHHSSTMYFDLPRLASSHSIKNKGHVIIENDSWNRTMFENHRNVPFNIATFTFCGDKKFIKKCQKWSILASFWKPEACGQIVLPDRSVLIGQKLVENAKIQKFKCDIFSDFQTLCICPSIFVQD